MTIFYIILLVLLVISFFMAATMGRHRHIGFIWTFFFCFTLTPIVGYIICIMSPLKSADKRLRGPTLFSFLLLLIICCGLIWVSIQAIIYGTADVTNDETTYKTIAYSIAACGFIGALVYELILTFSGSRSHRGRNLRQ